MRTHLIISAIIGCLSITAPSHSQTLTLKKGDHICLVGNALGERMQHHNYWEALLHQRFPDYSLAVRNLCFPGDEPLNRLRSLNFGTPDDHLRHSQASVILFFFGYNESFHGKHGLKAFTDDLTKLIQDTKKKNYSGKGAPRMVLVSPIAFENTGDPNLPDGKAHNARLAMYTEAMSKVAKETGVGFVNLFEPTKKMFENNDKQLTLDGGHLNEEGYKLLAPHLDQGLFGKENAPSQYPIKLMAELADKNFHWWHRYRAVNGYSIYGTRGKAGFDGRYRNRDVMERERAILDQMTANRDQRIWQIAQGKSVSAKVDDSNTLPFFPVKTNVGGSDDPNRKRGKLGSLKYIPAEEQKKFFKLAPGYEINLVASEKEFPELANPVALNFDNRGRLWVSTMPSYPQWKPKTKLDDKLIILEDTNGDGKADKCKTFAGGLHQPTGFEIGDGGVYVAQQPDILYLKDTNGDDKADVRIRKLVGFDTADSHHGLAAFEWGPGGALYFQEGTFKQSQVESPYGLQRLSDAGVWRYDPKTEKMEVHSSLAFANPWGHVFDRWGQNFIADASPGQNFWATPISGDVIFPDKHPGGCRDGHLDWGGSKSKKSYPTFLKKRIRPSSGCEIISSRHFPPEAQGNFLVNNVIGDLAVLQHTVKEVDSGFEATEITPLVKCDHGNFRPVDLQFGPDGALYIVDWHNALIGHLQHNLRDPSRDHSHGRIWRVTYTNRPLLTPPKIEGESIEKLLELLKLPEDRTRYRVRRELAQRETGKVIPVLKTWLAKLDQQAKDYEHHRLEALWMFQTHNQVNESLLKEVLRSKDPRARAAATRVASYWRDQLTHPLEIIGQSIQDDHPRVRLEAVRACSFIHSPESLEAALDVLEKPMDTYLEYTLDETIRVLEDVLGHGGAGMAHHNHGEMTKQPKPLVFLDKSPKIVQFQLDRLPASRLLLVERSADHKKFKPVFEAILTRNGVSRQDRQAAVTALAKLNDKPITVELLSATENLNWSQRGQRNVIGHLANILLSQPSKALTDQIEKFRTGTKVKNEATQAISFAGLIAADKADNAWELAKASPKAREAFLTGIALLPSAKMRNSLRDNVIDCLGNSQPIAVRQQAIMTLASINDKQQENFKLVANRIATGRLRNAVVNTLLSIPKAKRPADASAKVVETLVKLAETTPPSKRTTPQFLNAMHLADELLAKLPEKSATEYRTRLRKVVVRVIRLNTVHEEMRYDKPYFVVEAGRPAQLVLHNNDLMPHNLVITRPGKLKDVAMLAATLPATIDKQGRQYVPKSKDVLFATRMVESHKQAVMTFTAPKEPGEYPYVCTFPNHWMRMYGVMLVVDDLQRWNNAPTPPADPLGITRTIVKNWTMEDFSTDLDEQLKNRQTELGKQIFQEATCIQCHKVANQGGAVGPDLTDVYGRWKGDSKAVLREILEPSHKIEEKFALYNILTFQGKPLSGVITKQDKESITIVTNPEKPQPHVVKRDDIDEMIKSSISMMPKGIMDRFSKEEIYELLAYLRSLRPKK